MQSYADRGMAFCHMTHLEGSIELAVFSTHRLLSAAASNAFPG